jgi:hypothetical protein
MSRRLLLLSSAYWTSSLAQRARALQPATPWCHCGIWRNMATRETRCYYKGHEPKQIYDLDVQPRHVRVCVLDDMYIVTCVPTLQWWIGDCHCYHQHTELHLWHKERKSLNLQHHDVTVAFEETWQHGKPDVTTKDMNQNIYTTSMFKRGMCMCAFGWNVHCNTRTNKDILQTRTPEQWDEYYAQTVGPRPSQIPPTWPIPHPYEGRTYVGRTNQPQNNPRWQQPAGPLVLRYA